MDIPFFFSEELDQQTKSIFLDEPGSRHAVQVLRKKEGDNIQLANGKGVIARATITDAYKKKAEVSIDQVTYTVPAQRQISIGISLVKNAARFEWFLEKATEIGVTEIIPLLCHRTERQVFKRERMTHILISAMLQSKQAWMPVLQMPTLFQDVIKSAGQSNSNFIAHCEQDAKQALSSEMIKPAGKNLILIGPEGDFTTEEIRAALENNFIPVALGDTRLRTETAGMVASTLLKLL